MNISTIKIQKIIKEELEQVLKEIFSFSSEDPNLTVNKIIIDNIEKIPGFSQQLKNTESEVGNLSYKNFETRVLSTDGQNKFLLSKNSKLKPTLQKMYTYGFFIGKYQLSKIDPQAKRELYGRMNAFKTNDFVREKLVKKMPNEIQKYYRDDSKDAGKITNLISTAYSYGLTAGLTKGTRQDKDNIPHSPNQPIRSRPHGNSK